MRTNYAVSTSNLSENLNLCTMHLYDYEENISLLIIDVRAVSWEIKTTIDNCVVKPWNQNALCGTIVHIKACSNAFPSHNLLRCIFEDDKIHTSPCLDNTCKTDFDQDSKLQTFSSNRTPSSVFAWANIFRHKKWKRKIQPKANFEKLWQECRYEMASLEQN